MYQLVLPSTDPVPSSTNDYHCHGRTSKTTDKGKRQTKINDEQQIMTNDKQHATTNNNQ